MQQIFNTIFYQPLFNILVFFYNIIPGHDIGLTIIALTIVIKIILFPLAQKSLKSQRAMTRLQPQLEELKVKFKDDRAGQSKAMMELYKKEKISPWSSCLPLLIQLPFLLAVFWVFKNGLSNGSLNWLYSFVYKPRSLNPVAFGFLDLAGPNLVLGVAAGLAQYWQSKLMIGRSQAKGVSSMMNKQMLYMMPVLTVVFSFSLPAGLMLYWLVMTLLSVAQQELLFRKLDRQSGQPAAS